jgi:hypothetical protein
MIKFKVWCSKIQKTEAIKETDCFIWVINSWHSKPFKTAKRSEYANYFDTFEEAKIFLIQRTQDRIDALEKQLAYTKEELTEYKEITLEGVENEK